MDYLKIIKDLLALSEQKSVQTRMNSDSNKLIRVLKEEGCIDESQLMQTIYGKKKGVREKYRSLAGRAISILSNKLFLKPTERETDWKSVYQECVKKTALVKLLKTEDKQSAATNIATSTLIKAEKYGITEVCADLSKELMLSSQIKGEVKKSEEYRLLHHKYSNIRTIETVGYSTLNEVALISSKSTKPESKVISEIIAKLDSVVKIKEESYFINILRFKARIIKSNFLNDHPEFPKIYWEFEDFQSSLKFKPSTGHVFNTQNKISPSLIITKNYELAESNINKCLGLFVGEHNRNITLQHRAVLGFYTEDIEIIKDTFILAEENIKDLPPIYSEWWKIAKAYYHLLNITKSKAPEIFKVSRFVNDITVANKDKTGLNVSIITIGEYILRLVEGNRDFLIEQNEAIRLYSYRNLKEESTKRAQIFFQILRKISRSQFDPETFKSATQSHLSQLKTYTLKIEDLETEIIPYERLYEMIIYILENQKNGVRKNIYLKMKRD